MPLSRPSLQRRPWLVWIASALMLFHALAPVWARAQGPALVEMCSAVGNKWVAAPEGTGSQPPLVKALSHCQTCCAQSGDAWLPILPTLRFAPPECVSFLCTPAAPALRSRVPFSPAQARAPPRFPF